MARTETLTGLITRVRQRANMENSQFVTDTEITNHLNSNSLPFLYDLLVSAYGEDYYATITGGSVPDITTVVGTASYAIPSDFYKLLRVDRNVNGIRIPMRRWRMTDKVLYDASISISWGSLIGMRIFYKLIANNIQFHPIPDVVTTIRLYYVPTCPVLVSLSDSFDGVNGWEEIAVLRTAAYCLAKEESDTAFISQEMGEMVRRITDLASTRDEGNPERIADVQFLDQEYSTRYPWLSYGY